MIVLDASVLIAHLDDSDALHDRAIRLLSELTAEPWAASQLTLAEVLVGPAIEARRLPAASGKVRQVEAGLMRLGVTPLPLPEDAQVTLAEVRAASGLRLPDCCVVITAEQASAAVATFDERLARVAQDRGLKVWLDASGEG